ncbi:MAG: FAD-dependent oxidoreductase [Sphingopyxis sp.]|nr:FAD-dependent oxidoreductase [Sphingopyxis sp.]
MTKTDGFDCDVLVVGAGIAGASLAAALAGHRAVRIIEAEDNPARHSTGRSAALWHETYGGPLVQPLTIAGKPVIASPDPDFNETSFLSPRPALTIGLADEQAAVDKFVATFAAQGVDVRPLDHAGIAAHVPGLRPEWVHGAIEPDCGDIDVAGLHAAYLRQAKRSGAELHLRSIFQRARWRDGGWDVETSSGALRVHTLVNAAGGWADQIAANSGIRPIGIQPYQRTIVQLRLGIATPAHLPLTIHVGGEFYFKGEGEGRVWLSPHDETPVAAGDVAPEELDVAIAIDRFEHVVNWPIAAVERKWAGLRSFAPDRLPVFGADPANDRFVWCAGQGGFGIQTAPAIAGLLAEQLGAPADPAYAAIAAGAFSPARFA